MSEVNKQLKKMTLIPKVYKVPKPKIKTSNAIGPLPPGVKRAPPKPKKPPKKQLYHKGKPWPSMGPWQRENIQHPDKPGVYIAPPLMTDDEREQRIRDIQEAQRKRGVTDNSDIYPVPKGLKDWIEFFGPEGSGRARPPSKGKPLPESMKKTKKGKAIRRGKKK